MVDIDLNLLKIIVDPDVSAIKNSIDIIKEAFIEEYGEKYRKRISKNFDNVDYTG